ncbi:MAG TPA: hypothetical protein VJ761_12435 [Ktedonobacteraceae bacterium]|nr:hypothetical protein [Ktedonobacteraceae bacterium]
MPTWMIYGANGYMGELIAREAKARGLHPILAGRNARALSQLGQEPGATHASSICATWQSRCSS